MTIKVGQKFQTRGMGEVTILTLTGTYNEGKNPVVAQATNGNILQYQPDGKILNSPAWDLIVPRATGYINVWPTKDEALAHKKFAGQVTVPVDYEVE